MRPSLNIISDDLIKQILTEAKRILSDIGVEVRGKNLRQRLQDQGLKAHPQTDRILFPAEVVEQAIQDAPSSFSLYTRDGDPYTVLGGDNVNFVPGSSGLRMLDHQTNEVRLATTADFVDYVRLCDGLKNIAYLATAFSTNDIEADISDAWRLYLCLTHSQKPVVSGAFTEDGVPRMAHMMQLFRQDKADLIARPMSIFTITATGMFRYSEDSCQNLLDCVEWGIPVEIVPVTLMGLIAPVTLVGATVMHVADVLAGLTMTQIVKPGAPVLFGGAPATFHMKQASSPMAAIEAQHLNVAYVAVAKALNLPTQAYMALSDAKILDAQAGAETFGSALLAAMAGVNSVSGPGMLDYVLVFSLEKLVFDDEVCGQALHFARSFAPLEDLPTLDLVNELLEEQHMLTADHTIKHWPNQLYLPGQVFDRFTREDWVKQGKPSLMERAHLDVNRRLADYEPVSTDPQCDAELRCMMTVDLPDGTELPPIPPLKAKSASQSTAGRRRRRRQRPTN
ncbi:MAG: trimethylamine methyltransferase family protein [Chloroflexota bacterium]